jgi:RimJ/RimL family protein N-acetyltransferase
MEIALAPVSVASLDAELAGDLPRLAAILDACVGEWPPIDGGWDLDAIRQFRAAAVSPTADPRLGPFYVIADGELVASAGFFGPPDESFEVEIGYSVCAGHRRRGVATSIITDLCRRAPSFGARAILARVRPDNVGSLKALERNGFTADEQDRGDGFIVLRRPLG